mmetsp:Transcript_35806/g.62821  ORF Transcript_35806/g.62821 Transcript_35806/m.62821 type:complete len:232 (+) Transcript_35806:2635-3330(+)
MALFCIPSGDSMAFVPAGEFAALPVFTTNLPFFFTPCEAAAASTPFEDKEFLLLSVPFAADWSKHTSPAFPFASSAFPPLFIPLVFCCFKLFSTLDGTPVPVDAISAPAVVSIADKLALLPVFTRNLPFFLAQGFLVSATFVRTAKVLSLLVSFPLTANPVGFDFSTVTPLPPFVASFSFIVFFTAFVVSLLCGGLGFFPAFVAHSPPGETFVAETAPFFTTNLPFFTVDT